MADQVTKETDQRLEEAAERVDKVLRDMEDLTPVSDALLSTRRGLGDASSSIARLAEQAGAAMEQWKMALAAFETAAKALQDVPSETQEAVNAASTRVKETVGRLRADLVEARESSTATAEKVADVAALLERTREVLEAELRRLRILLWVGCGIGALVAALMVVQVLGP